MMIKIVAGLATLFGSASIALAVGDIPVKLDRRQATLEYSGVRNLLVNEGRRCPAGEAPASGLVTSGSAPVGGSRTVTIYFNKGAIVQITRRWSSADTASSSSALTVTCASNPAVHPGKHRASVPTMQSDNEYLQQRATSLADRITNALEVGKLTSGEAAKLRQTVGQVQKLASDLETRTGTIVRTDADRMNQQLTDVERQLPLQ